MTFPPNIEAHEFYWRKTVQESPWRSWNFLTVACFSGMNLLGLAWMHKHERGLLWPVVVADFLLLTICWAGGIAVRRQAVLRTAAATSRMEEQAILRSTYRRFFAYQLAIMLAALVFLTAQAIFS